MISVLTPTIPERSDMLAECIASVKAQTYTDVEHLIGLDEERRGCAWTMNSLAKQAKGEWVVPFADDDLLLPGALGKLLAASQEADVVYAPPLVSGNGSQHFFAEVPYAPSFGLIRRTLWQVVGGYDVSRRREEDRAFWFEALAQGARFVRVDEPLWVYRFTFLADGTPRNKSYARGVSS